jgi:hypothetical protein
VSETYVVWLKTILSQLWPSSESKMRNPTRMKNYH